MSMRQGLNLSQSLFEIRPFELKRFAPRPQNARHKPARSGSLNVALGVFALAGSGTAWATVAEPPGIAHQHEVAADSTARIAQQVYALMEVETAQAIARARHAPDISEGYMADLSSSHEAPMSQDAHGADRLTLIAIYGIGKKLAAQVMAGTKQYLYRHGQAYPVGMTAESSDTDAYQLRGISSSCVVLERDQQAQTLCIHPDFRVNGAAGRP